ncbi:MAG: polysaccharide biosynthesis/export family protein [Gemmatimonadota bacterium]
MKAGWCATLMALAWWAAPAAAQEPPGEGWSPLLEPLRPGDAIVLSVWREPDWEGTFRVDTRGIVVLPRIGRMDVTGRTPLEIEKHILDELTKSLTHTSIEVVFLRRIAVQGAVREPAMYDVDPTLTVADALALAGGTTPEGDAERIQLLRAGQVMPVSISERTVISASPIRSGDQLFVPERSWLSRNPGTVAAIASGLLSVVLILVR